MSNLKALRKAAGFTQFQLAKRSGVSRFRIGMAESESMELRPEEWEAISKVIRPGIERAARLATEFQTECHIASG
jgi:transcriptional regulator with XRE-family HTH domain